MLIWRNFDTIEAQAEGLCAALVRALHDVLEHQPRALLALSGGSSPRALLRRLAHAGLPWERIDLLVTDLEPGDERLDRFRQHTKVV